MKKFSLIPATESIDFQDPTFFRDLVQAFDDLRKVPKADLEKPETHAVLAAVIKDHTKMKARFEIGWFGPAVEIPDLTKNHALLTADFQRHFEEKDGIKLITTAGAPTRGSVSLKKGIVTGAFCDLEPLYYLPTELFTSKIFSSEECAAMMLHEVGHVFVLLEFVTRVVRTNQVLAGISRALDNTAGAKEREVVLTTAKHALNLKELDVEATAKANRKVIEVVVLGAAVKQAESEIGSNIYDENNFEYLADQFAARHGSGRHLVTALDKIYRMNLDIAMKSKSSYIYGEAVKISLLVLSVAGMIVAPALALSLTAALTVSAILGHGLILFALLVTVDSDVSPDYDRPMARMKRVRNQLVESIKDKKLPPERGRQILEDIAAIDKILEGVKDQTQVMGIIAEYLIPSVKERISAERLQQELEGLAANDLFTRSAELRTLI
jgi:hypothetical protein